MARTTLTDTGGGTSTRSLRTACLVADSRRFCDKLIELAAALSIGAVIGAIGDALSADNDSLSDSD